MAEINRPDLQYKIEIALRNYDEAVSETVRNSAAKAMKRLVKLTKETAPIGRRFVRRKADENRPHLFESISSMRKHGPIGTSVFIWYVKAPNNRIAHLAEHGHYAGKDLQWYTHGSRFVAKAVAEILPEYEAEIKEAVGHGI